MWEDRQLWSDRSSLEKEIIQILEENSENREISGQMDLNQLIEEMANLERKNGLI